MSALFLFYFLQLHIEPFPCGLVLVGSILLGENGGKTNISQSNVGVVTMAAGLALGLHFRDT